MGPIIEIEASDFLDVPGPRPCHLLFVHGIGLTITFLRLMARAPLERHTETIMGGISGISPTATARAKKKAPFQSCLVNPLMRKTNGTITPMNFIISHVKRLRP